MDSKLAQLASLNQRDKASAYTSLVPEILAQPSSSIAKEVHTLVDYVVNQDTAGLVVARQVLSELVKGLGEGAIKDTELRRKVIEDTLETVQPRIVSYEEQVCLCLRVDCWKSIDSDMLSRLITCGSN
jgi:COP9 signalosome complex subunit 4